MSRSSLKNVCRLIKEVQEEIPIEQQFLTDLNRSIELSDAKNRRLPSKTYKPSSMNCIRNMYFQRVGETPDEADTGYCLIGICNSGTDIHERTQKAVADMINNNIDCEYINVAEFVKQRNLDYLDIVSQQGMETKLFHKELNMSFLCDGIIRYKDHYYILELKTENSNKFYSRNSVDTKHYNQGTAYSIAFGLPEVIFVYISRDNLDMKSFMFKPTDEMKQNLIGKIDLCEQCVNVKTPPPMQMEINKRDCQYCSYKKVCEATK